MKPFGVQRPAGGILVIGFSRNRRDEE